MARKFDPLKHCLHLCSKEMFYEVEDAEADAHREHVERVYGACDTTTYWCQRTQTGRGPDEKPVSASSCAAAGRSCFEGLRSIT
jgi:hypothetical protein